jgi:4-amino-4-deoxy-L-arabinose transferase-like glycosyltransferase
MPKIFFIISILIGGFLLRFWLSSLNHTPLIYDMETNQQHALEFLDGKMAVDCCNKNMGYSMFLALIYRLIPPVDTETVRFVQILIDVLVGIVVFMAAGRIFSRNSALAAMAIYLLNPITSAFTGLLLSEILTFLIVATLAYFMTVGGFRIRPGLWLFTGIALGTLVFVRLQFFHFTMLFVPILALSVIGGKLRWKFLFAVLAGFLVGSAYVPLANYANYGHVSFVPPYAWTWGVGLYSNYFRETRKFEIFSPLNKEPHPVELAIVREYSFTTDNQAYRVLENRYRGKFIAEFPQRWREFFLHSLQNIIWLWDKDHLSEYQDPFHPDDRIWVRLYNSILLILYLVGISGYVMRGGASAWRQPVVLFSLTLFLYISALFPLISNESRHTLAFYPVLILWSGYGCMRIMDAMQYVYIKHSKSAKSNHWRQSNAS